jgi:hypothetical protein
MAITQYNYSPDTYEAITDEALDDSPVLNTWYYFEIDGWKHTISDVVLKQAGVELPTSAYELTIDQKYTDSEENESGKTLYAMWRIVDGSYDLIATTVSGNNFGSYVDNETIAGKLDTLQTEIDSISFDADEIAYDNTVSGLTADEVQAAIDELASGGSYVPPTLGSEVVAYSASLSGSTTASFEIKEPPNYAGKSAEAYVKFTSTKTGGSIVSIDLYMISSVSGTESGSTGWAKVTGLGERIFKLQPGLYRIYIYFIGPSGTGDVSVKYKWANTQISYS